MMQETDTISKHTSVVSVNDLDVSFITVDGQVAALRNITFELQEGEILGIIGESGSGKSTLALSMMSLLPENAIVSGNVKFEDEEVTSAKNSGKAYFKIPPRKRRILDERLANIRWKGISMVFQGAMNSLNPVYTVRKQIEEVFHLHTDYSKEQINDKIQETARLAGFNTSYLDSYPHELSGGMKQRAVLTMALALDPKLVIADEPTTGLDVITQAKIISQFRMLKETGRIKSMVIISHDIGVVAQLADRIMVLYGGKVMEVGTPEEIYVKSANPYTKALAESYPSIRSTRRLIKGIPGSVPDLLNPPTGCYFAERCVFADKTCYDKVPDSIEISPNHFSLCHYAKAFSQGKLKASRTFPESSDDNFQQSYTTFTGDVIEAKDLSKHYDLIGSASERLFSIGSKRKVHAVDHVTFNIKRKEILGVVGESGSGKTTLGRTLILSIPPTSGKLVFYHESPNGTEELDLFKLKTRDKNFLDFRLRNQLIFQDPYDSINPKMSVFDIVSEPLNAQRKKYKGTDIETTVYSALETANLKPASNYVNRYPHELSGGERQRVSIARSLVTRPEFLVTDEPISMLDVSIRANIMNLLKKIRDEFDLTILYISHDIASTRYMADRVIVMYLGAVVEMGPSEDVIANPMHPYTKALISAIPQPDPRIKLTSIDIIGEVGNSINLPKGCRFFDRCVFRKDICRDTPPPVKGSGDRFYVCHFDQGALTKNDRIDDDSSSLQ